MSEHPVRAYRPLAPRTEPAAEGDEGGSPNGSAPEERRMRRVSTACRECQRRRTRCSGAPQCSECRIHNRDCVFDEAADRRRKASARRTQDQLDHYRALVDDLLGIIRERDGQTVQSIIDIIRSGAELVVIRDMLTNILEKDLGRLDSNSHARNSNVYLQIGSNSRPNNSSNNLDANNVGNYLNPNSI
ncbi:C6 transcription factor SndA [Penicillium paradoxum]|uniref:C6 transcription factor SndA n=1 Tax=Penicillium paradoxum TaxID=176176 RepID=UPI002548B885|nr:C6 transcription factor SndA [Penicillium paradoxum]KAJ5773370.1 C6 transcription factor SndA [Penicillium paradoxum]